MSKKNKRAQQGTYALCITVGLFIGVGLIPMLGNPFVPPLLGAACGYGAARYLTRQQSRKKH